MLKQRTIARATGVNKSIGLHSGQPISMELQPAEKNAGIVFRRADIDPVAEARCAAQLVCNTQLATCISFGTAQVDTVEHLMSAFAALGIDNITIELSGQEIPCMDGSAAPFILMVKNAGVVEQDAPKRLIRVLKPVSVSHEDPNGGAPKRASLEPHAGFVYEVEIDFSHPTIQRSGQKMSFSFGDDDYEQEVARARTFGFVDEIEFLRGIDRALGGSYENAVVLSEYKVLNKEELRYPDEFVRHKLLDAIGDCYIGGHLVIGKYTAYKPGHQINNMLIRKLLEDDSAWEWTNGEGLSVPPVA